MFDLEKEIEKALMEEADRVKGVLVEAVEQVTKETVSTLKNTSPKDSGKYKNSWTKADTTESIGNVQKTVYVKSPHHRLSHLLEYGHAKVNGGRTKAFHFIEPAEKEAVKKFESLVRKGIEK